MPKCIPCMSKSLKQAILNFTDDPQTTKAVNEIATCPTGIIMDLCLGGTKTGRQPSAYQQFIGQCMKSKPIKGKPFGEAAKYMKECSAQWKQQKK